jgi:hypothetical protein
MSARAVMAIMPMESTLAAHREKTTTRIGGGKNIFH